MRIYDCLRVKKYFDKTDCGENMNLKRGEISYQKDLGNCDGKNNHGSRSKHKPILMGINATTFK